MRADEAQSFKVRPANPNGHVEHLHYTMASALEGQPIPERRWAVEGWVPDHQVTMISGDGGVGKTLIAHQLMTACVLGRDWLGMPVKPCKAFGLFCEDDEAELHRRQEAINRLYDCSFGDLEEKLAWFSFVGGDASLATFRNYDGQEATEFHHRLADTVMSVGAQLVVIDSLHDVFAGNEIDRVQARGFIRQLQDLAQGIDGAVVLTSHPSRAGRADGSGESGSTAWNNAVRSRLYLSRPKDEEDTDRRILARKKANYTSINEEIPLDWRDGVLVPRYQSTGAVKGMEGRNCQRVFLELLATVEREGRPVSHKPRASNYAPKMFAKKPPKTREGFGPKELERAMEELFDSGQIGVGTYLDSSRRAQEKIRNLKPETLPF